MVFQAKNMRVRGGFKSARSSSLDYQTLEQRQLLAVVISEFLTSNVATQKDGYNNSPDWIELYNNGSSAVDLAGYHLTDDASDLNQWAFPASTSLAANDYLVVFASSRDEVDPLGNLHTNFKLSTGGEYVALVSPSGAVLSEFGSGGADYPDQVDDVSYGVSGITFFDGTSPSHYLIPTNGNLGTTWTQNNFDPVANGFTSSTASIGYEDNPNSGTSYKDEILTTLPSGTTNTFFRTEFDVLNASAVTELTLGIKYDDGFGVYLNGNLLLTRNAENGLAYDAIASAKHNDFLALQFEPISLDDHVGFLVDGKNTLAIHLLNDGAGSSDYLLVPRLTSNSPGISAGYLETPTPGATNSGLITLGPAIRNVTKNPVVNPGESLIVTAEVSDFDLALNSSTVQLHYRQGFASEIAVQARDDGTGGDAVANDGVYSATIPNVGSAGDLLRWYFTADDVAGNTARAPRFAYALNSAEYFGTVVADNSYTSEVPAFHWFLENPAGASTDNGARGALFFNGELYDNVEANAHGQSTRGVDFPKKSFDFDANSGDKFLIRDDIGRASDFNLLTNYADQSKIRNSIGYDLWESSGHPASLESFSVAVFRNGAYYGLYDLVEEGDEEFLEREGIDENGALYKVNNQLSSSIDNVDKRSRNYEDNSDLQALVDANQNLSGAAFVSWILDNVETATLINYLAVNAIIGNTDFGHKNMHWYIDSDGTGQWSPIPWDIDLSFGHKWNGSLNSPYFDNAMLTNVSHRPGFNDLFYAVYGDNTLREMYDRRLRTLSDQFFGAPGTSVANSYLGQKIAEFENLVDDLAAADLTLWGQHPNFSAAYPENPMEAADQILNVYIDGRRQYITSRSGIPNSQSGNPSVLFTSDFDQSPVSGLQAEEYLRLENPNNTSVDISNWEIRGGIDHRFLAGTVIPANGSIYVVKDVVAFKARTTGPRGGQSLVIQGNYSGQLASTGETLELVSPDGTVIDTLMTPNLGLSDIQQYLQVTEINYDPLVSDAEFIELMNISAGGASVTLDLTGVSITDGPSSPFVFGSLSLAAGDRILVVKDSAAFIAVYPSVSPTLIAGEFDGKLSNNGETIRIEDAGAAKILEFDYGAADPWASAANGAGASLQLIDETTPNDLLGKYYSWRSSSQTGGTPGSAPLAVSAPIVINEILAHTDLPNVDSIELYNSSAVTINIGGWYLSDQKSNLQKFQIPAGTNLGAGEYIVFDENDFNPNPTSPGLNDFALSSNGDSVYLTFAVNTQTNAFVDAVRFGATFNGETIGRLPDGSGRFSRMDGSLGEENDRHKFSNLLIAEVNYHPDAPATGASITQQQLEFVEIFNPTTQAIDLTDWRIRGEVDFDFAVGSSIGAGEALVVVSFDPEDVENAVLLAEFRSHYGIGAEVNLVGGFEQNLSNSFGRISLQQPDQPDIDGVPRVVVDEVVYDDRAPFENADGNGSSLHRDNTNALGSMASSWVSGAATPGTSILASASVEHRSIFYNNSVFDGNQTSFDVSDDLAIGSNKSPLMPGQNASFANYTSYVHGINGLFIDTKNLPVGVVLTSADFLLATGNGSQASDFTASAATFDIDVRRGAGLNGEDRIGLVFADGTFTNTWLQVTLLANGNTRLASNDVFYFGNAVGEAGNSGSDAEVSSADVLLTRGNRTSPFNPANQLNNFDFNRDSIVDGVDVLIARRSRTTPFNELVLITAPTSGDSPQFLMGGGSNGPDGDGIVLGLSGGSDDQRQLPEVFHVATIFDGGMKQTSMFNVLGSIRIDSNSPNRLELKSPSGVEPQRFAKLLLPEREDAIVGKRFDGKVEYRKFEVSGLSNEAKGSLQAVRNNSFVDNETRLEHESIELREAKTESKAGEAIDLAFANLEIDAELLESF